MVPGPMVGLGFGGVREISKKIEPQMFQQNSIFDARGIKFECNVYYDSILKFMK